MPTNPAVRRWKRDNPHRVRAHSRTASLKALGTTPEQYDAMFEQQNGVCAICGRPETKRRNGRVKSLAVDHDHTTGKIRGLLCQACNTGIGLLEENERTLLAAVEYLRSGVTKPSRR